jgi:hypothetical protein
MCEPPSREEDLGGEYFIYHYCNVGAWGGADYWQSVEARIVEENKALSMERSHLSDLMANVQKMHNDIERSSENDRRRLESQIQLLENQRFVIFEAALVIQVVSQQD